MITLYSSHHDSHDWGYMKQCNHVIPAIIKLVVSHLLYMGYFDFNLFTQRKLKEYHLKPVNFSL